MTEERQPEQDRQHARHNVDGALVDGQQTSQTAERRARGDEHCGEAEHEQHARCQHRSAPDRGCPRRPRRPRVRWLDARAGTARRRDGGLRRTACLQLGAGQAGHVRQVAGTNGRQHGDRNDTSPAATAIGAASRNGPSVTVATRGSMTLTMLRTAAETAASHYMP